MINFSFAKIGINFSPLDPLIVNKILNFYNSIYSPAITKPNSKCSTNAQSFVSKSITVNVLQEGLVNKWYAP